MSFKRTIENFTCLHCGAEVTGDGYTNHCPHCLWSRHVDVDPGDRAAECKGMMKPVRVEGASDALRLVHECEICGHTKRNDVHPDDDRDCLIALARAQAGA